MDLLRSAKGRLSTLKLSTSKAKSFHEQYELGEVLGEGAFAQVRVGRDRLTQEGFAVKIMDLRTPSHVADFKTESALTKKASGHPNCVRMVSSFMERHLVNTEKNLGYMALEKCRCSLSNVMKDEPELIEAKLVSLFQQGLEGLAHIHEQGVAHRDVKPDNFLLGGQCGTVLKLCDFGLAAAIPKKGSLKGIYGTAPYMSPELLANQNYDCKTDVWSFAVVVFLMMFGEFPYEPKIRNADAMKKAILHGKPAPTFSDDEEGNFASDLLKRNPQFRYTAREALAHEFLKPKASLKRSWTSQTLQSAAKLDRAVSREFKVPADPGRTKDLNDILDDLQEQGQNFFFNDDAEMQEQCTVAGDEATEGHILEMVRKHNSVEQLGLKISSLSAKALKMEMPWVNDPEYDNRSTQVPTNETLPELDFVSESSQASEQNDEELSQDGESTWNPAKWSA